MKIIDNFIRLLGVFGQVATLEARTTSDRRQATNFYPFLYWPVVLILAAVTLLVYIEFSNLEYNPYHQMAPDFIYQTGYQPFVYRVMVPWLARSILPLISIETAKAVHSNQALARALNSLDYINWPRQSLAVLIVMAATLLAAILAFRYLCAGLAYSPVKTDVLTLFYIPSMLGFAPLAYCYDFSSLAMLTLGLALIQRGRWGLYLLVFFLATLAKETSVLLLLVFLLAAWGRTPFYCLLAADQAGIYGATKLVLLYAYLHNPGVLIQWHFFDQVRYLFGPGAGLLVVDALIAVLIAWRWQHKPLFLRQALVMFPAMFILYLAFGFPGETRVFLDVFPVVFLMTIPK